MSSCTVAPSNSPIFSPSSSSCMCSPKACSSPRLFRPQKTSSPSGLIRASAGGDFPAVLKRKRPPRLDIPAVLLDSSAKKEADERLELEGDGFSVCCKKGRREVMEDRYAAVVDLHGGSNQAFFGVFDGHGGVKAAEFAAENLVRNIVNELERREDGDGIELAVKKGFLITDSEFLRRDEQGGTCCVTALMRHGNLVVSNAGDCRAVVSRGGVAEVVTSDHRPSREDERDRIEALGGFVDNRNGVWRVLGSLAVSRAIGDQYLKRWITAEPETRILTLKPEHEFLILASDGLWEKVSNQEAVDIAGPLLANLDKPMALSACKKLVDVSASRGAIDDISVMLIQLGRFANTFGELAQEIGQF